MIPGGEFALPGFGLARLDDFVAVAHTAVLFASVTVRLPFVALEMADSIERKSEMPVSCAKDHELAIDS